jgi:hypothetical protein
MRQHGDRTINVSKDELIEKIKLNKKYHLVDYEDAVEAYKKEAEKQLLKQLADLQEGSLDIKLNLTKPINSEDEYDKLILMFEMEVEEVVQLSLQEFNQYIHDETEFARSAKFSNSFYTG